MTAITSNLGKSSFFAEYVAIAYHVKFMSHFNFRAKVGNKPLRMFPTTTPFSALNLCVLTKTLVFIHLMISAVHQYP